MGKTSQRERSDSEDLPASAQHEAMGRVAWKFLLAGTLLGLFLGICEGIILLVAQPHAGFPAAAVGPIILLLAPLIDAVTFGILGACLGLAAELARQKRRRYSSRLAIAGFFVYGTFGTFVAIKYWEWMDGQGRMVVLGSSVLGGAIFAAAAARVWRLLWGHAVVRLPSVRSHLPALIRVSTIVLAVSVLGFGAFRMIDIAPRAPSSQRTELIRARSPDVVIIALDTARADHFSSYGYARDTTPKMDHVAQQGVVFENAVAAASWTLPSFTSVFTGLLPHQTSIDSDRPLPGGFLTLASILHSHGYQTAAFNGNFWWGMKRTGTAEGFDTFDDSEGTLRGDLARISPVAIFWWLFYYPFIRPDHIVRRDAREMNRAVLGWLNPRSRSPFFLFVNYFDVHEPYYAIPEMGNRFGVVEEPLVQRIRDEFEHGVSAWGVPNPAADRAALIARYDSALAYADMQIGNLLRRLESSPEWSNTYVIIIGDHGQSLGEHGHFGHGWGLTWEQIHVPLIIAGPGIPKGRRITDVVSLPRLFDTILDLSGDGHLTRPAESLRCYWTHPASTCNAAPIALSELSGDLVIQDEDRIVPTVSVVTPEWHFIHDAAGNEELYHRSSDPMEELNLATAPIYAAEVKNLQRRLFEQIQASSYPWRGDQYLWGLGEQQFSLLTGKHMVNPNKPSTPDNDLLRSMPYQ